MHLCAYQSCDFAGRKVLVNLNGEFAFDKEYDQLTYSSVRINSSHESATRQSDDQ